MGAPGTYPYGILAADFDGSGYNDLVASNLFLIPGESRPLLNQSGTKADLSIAQTDSPDPVNAGSTLTYTLTATNAGPGTPTVVKASDTLPAGVTFNAAASSGTCSASGSAPVTVTCNYGSVVSGSPEAQQVGVTVGGTAPASIANTASVAGNLADATPANNTSSATTTVNLDTTQPTHSFTLSNAVGASKTGSTVYYKGNAVGSFNVVDALADTGTGPASVTFPAAATIGWTHNAETVTTPAGGPYTSTTFSWTANPSNPTGYTVTGTDNAGNSNPAAVTLASDTTAPATGSVGYTNGMVYTASVPVTTANGTDGGSGIETSSGLVKRAQAHPEHRSTQVCGAFGGFTTTVTLVGGADTTVVSGNCYQYRYLISDNVGNQATYSSASIVKVDTVTPTNSLSLTSDRRPRCTGTTVYYKGNAAGSFRLVNAVDRRRLGPGLDHLPGDRDDRLGPQRRDGQHARRRPLHLLDLQLDGEPRRTRPAKTRDRHGTPRAGRRTRRSPSSATSPPPPAAASATRTAWSTGPLGAGDDRQRHRRRSPGSTPHGQIVQRAGDPATPAPRSAGSSAASRPTSPSSAAPTPPSSAATATSTATSSPTTSATRRPTPRPASPRSTPAPTRRRSSPTTGLVNYWRLGESTHRRLHRHVHRHRRDACSRAAPVRSAPPGRPFGTNQTTRCSPTRTASAATASARPTTLTSGVPPSARLLGPGRRPRQVGAHPGRGRGRRARRPDGRQLLLRALTVNGVGTGSVGAPEGRQRGRHHARQRPGDADRRSDLHGEADDGRLAADHVGGRVSSSRRPTTATSPPPARPACGSAMPARPRRRPTPPASTSTTSGPRRWPDDSKGTNDGTYWQRAHPGRRRARSGRLEHRRPLRRRRRLRDRRPPDRGRLLDRVLVQVDPGPEPERAVVGQRRDWSTPRSAAQRTTSASRCAPTAGSSPGSAPPTSRSSRPTAATTTATGTTSSSPGPGPPARSPSTSTASPPGRRREPPPR